MAVTIAAAAGCQKNEVANGSANAPANKAAANTSNSANTTTAASVAVDLSTPTATYKTAYNARQNRDIATLKRVLSKDVQDFLIEIGKEEDKDGAKGLDDMLKELCDRPQGPSAEVRNEKINGDKASIEYLDETGAWQTMNFAKEGSEWKMSIGPEDEPEGAENPKDKKK
jgi:hypothetical protein